VARQAGALPTDYIGGLCAGRDLCATWFMTFTFLCCAHHQHLGTLVAPWLFMWHSRHHDNSSWCHTLISYNNLSVGSLRPTVAAQQQIFRLCVLLHGGPPLAHSGAHHSPAMCAWHSPTPPHTCPYHTHAPLPLLARAAPLHARRHCAHVYLPTNVCAHTLLHSPAACRAYLDTPTTRMRANARTFFPPPARRAHTHAPLSNTFTHTPPSRARAYPTGARAWADCFVAAGLPRCASPVMDVVTVRGLTAFCPPILLTYAFMGRAGGNCTHGRAFGHPLGHSTMCLPTATSLPGTTVPFHPFCMGDTFSTHTTLAMAGMGHVSTTFYPSMGHVVRAHIYT